MFPTQNFPPRPRAPTRRMSPQALLPPFYPKPALSSGSPSLRKTGHLVTQESHCKHLPGGLEALCQPHRWCPAPVQAHSPSFLSCTAAFLLPFPSGLHPLQTYPLTSFRMTWQSHFCSCYFLFYCYHHQLRTVRCPDIPRTKPNHPCMVRRPSATAHQSPPMLPALPLPLPFFFAA